MRFVFGAKPSNHNIGIIFGLVEKQFQTIGWSEKFAVDIKKVHLLFANYYREIFGDCKNVYSNLDSKKYV